MSKWAVPTRVLQLLAGLREHRHREQVGPMTQTPLEEAGQRAGQLERLHFPWGVHPATDPSQLLLGTQRWQNSVDTAPARQ